MYINLSTMASIAKNLEVENVDNMNKRNIIYFNS